jgi:hypothetical protein
VTAPAVSATDTTGQGGSAQPAHPGAGAARVQPAAEQASRTAEPVRRAADVVGAAEPVRRAADLVGAGEPVKRASEELAGATRPVPESTAPLGGAVGPVVQGAERAGGFVAGPVIPGSGPGVTVVDVVRDVTGSVVGVSSGGRSSQSGGEGSGLSGGLLHLGFGGPSGRFDRSGSDHRGSEFGAAGRQAAGIGAGAPAPDLAPIVAPGSHLPGLAPREPAPLGAPGEPPPIGPPAEPAAGPSASRGEIGILPWPADFLGAGVWGSQSAIGAAPGWTPLAAAPDPRLAAISPEDHPTPSPSAPAGAGTASSAGAASGGPVLALLALLVLAAPSLSRFLKTVPEFLRPAPFIVALERPG